MLRKWRSLLGEGLVRPAQKSERSFLCSPGLLKTSKYLKRQLSGLIKLAAWREGWERWGVRGALPTGEAEGGDFTEGLTWVGSALSCHTMVTAVCAESPGLCQSFSILTAILK